MTTWAKVLEAGLVQHLDPTLQELDFARRRRLRWRRGDLEVRAIIDSKAKDPFRGGAFTLEFEKSEDGRFEVKLAGIIRVDQLLDDDQIQRFLVVRNLIATRLERPRADYVSTLPESLREDYMATFAPVEELEPRPWMRFATPDDVREWCRLLSPMMAQLVERTASIAPHELLPSRATPWR